MYLKTEQSPSIAKPTWDIHVSVSLSKFACCLGCYVKNVKPQCYSIGPNTTSSATPNPTTVSIKTSWNLEFAFRKIHPRVCKHEYKRVCIPQKDSFVPHLSRLSFLSKALLVLNVDGKKRRLKCQRTLQE